MQDWYAGLFGPDYMKMDWHDTTLAEVNSLVQMLELGEEDCILDLCCGYGRHAIPLAARGPDVTALDLSEALLAEAQKAAHAARVQVHWVRGDARRLPFEESFDIVLNLLTSFGYFEKEGDNLRVLQEAHRVLVPGGYLVLDTVNHDFLVRYFERQNWYDRGDALVLEERNLDHVESRVYGSWTIVNPDGSRRSYPNSIRTYTFAELRLLLTLAGFTVIQVNGGYGGEELTWDAPRMLIVCQK